MRNSEVVRPLEVIGEEVGHEDAEVTHVVVERVATDEAQVLVVAGQVLALVLHSDAVATSVAQEVEQVTERILQEFQE